MKYYIYRGKRIRAGDKDLVFRFAAAYLLSIFLLVILLLHIRTIMRIDWKNISLLNKNEVHLDIPYLIISIVIATVICLVVAVFYYQHHIDYIKQLFHRQKLARMILENKWYEVEQVQSNSLFKDLPSGRTKERITHFPKVYYMLKNGLIHIQVEITLGKYQDQLLHLEKKLESGLYCELTNKELKDSYVEYTLLYDTIANRISIEDVQAKHGKLRFMIFLDSRMSKTRCEISR